MSMTVMTKHYDYDCYDIMKKGIVYGIDGILSNRIVQF